VTETDARRFVRGCVFPAHGQTPYPRADLDDIRLPVDIGTAARVPATVRLEITGDAETVEVEYHTARLPQGPQGTTFSVWCGHERLANVKAAVGAGSVRLPLGDGVTTVYLPEAMSPTVTAVNGDVEPAAPRPRWLAYGDSVTEGWGASAPALSWLATAGRELDLDVVNFGYAAAGRGELAVAEMIAGVPADVISLAFGTNCWSRIPFDPGLLAATFRSFVAVLRQGHPHVPFVVASPIVRPDAEDTPNRLGATLRDLRQVIEDTAAELSETDPLLHLVRGGKLLRPEHLSDGIHPNDAGHALLATAITEHARPLTRK
jgi:lysophospholipase L1-like esterase